jgi:Tol biopolymer transport system component
VRIFGHDSNGDELSKITVADARGHIRWTFGEAPNNGLPLWAPDGRHIAYFFGWAHMGGLAVARRDGSDAHDVATSPPFPTYGPNQPAWTADGQRLAFVNGDDVDLPQGIYSVRPDGGGLRLLVGEAVEPAFSPDGSKLAYVALARSGQTGIFVADTDGRNPRVLSSSAHAVLPTWSPDASHIAFLRDSAVVVAKVDGSGERVISEEAGGSQVVSPPLWSPGGKLVAYSRAPSVGHGPGSLVVARVDGGGKRVVLRRLKEYHFAWRPAIALPSAKRPRCPLR